MDNELFTIINNEFSETDREIAIEKLSSILLTHVMADSEQNLFNTQLSVLKLSKGNIKDLEHYVASAKKDFRDVIYWATNK